MSSQMTTLLPAWVLYQSTSCSAHMLHVTIATCTCVFAGARGLRKSGSLDPSTSDVASAASLHMLQTDRYSSCKHAGSVQQHSAGQQQQQAGRRQQDGGALSPVPEHAVLARAISNDSVQAVEPRKLLKKKRKKVKRRSRLSQLGGMTDVEKARWMLEHCKVACAA